MSTLAGAAAFERGLRATLEYYVPFSSMNPCVQVFIMPDDTDDGGDGWACGYECALRRWVEDHGARVIGDVRAVIDSGRSRRLSMLSAVIEFPKPITIDFTAV